MSEENKGLLILDAYLQKAKSGSWSYNTSKRIKPQKFFGQPLPAENQFSYNDFKPGVQGAKSDGLHYYWLNGASEADIQGYRIKHGEHIKMILDLSLPFDEQCIDLLTMSEHTNMVKKGLTYYEFRALPIEEQQQTSEQPHAS